MANRLRILGNLRLIAHYRGFPGIIIASSDSSSGKKSSHFNPEVDPFEIAIADKYLRSQRLALDEFEHEWSHYEQLFDPKWSTRLLSSTDRPGGIGLEVEADLDALNRQEQIRAKEYSRHQSGQPIESWRKTLQDILKEQKARRARRSSL